MLIGGKSLVEVIDGVLDDLMHLSHSGAFLELGGVGVDEGGEVDLRAVLSADDRALCYSLDVAEVLLDLLREYVLAVFKHDYGLKASCDEAVFVLVEISDVACSEPAVLGECFSGSLGVVVIAKHDVVALDLNLALHIALVILIPLSYSYLAAGNRGTYRRVLTLVVRNHAGKRSALGDTVTLVDSDTEGIEELDHTGIESRAAADYLLKSAAEGVEDLRKEIAALINAYLEETSCRGDTELELLVSARLLSLCPDLLVEGVDVEGNEHKTCGLEYLKVLENVSDRVVDADVHTVVHSRKHTSELVGVVNGKERNDSVVGSEIYSCGGTRNYREYVFLREHYALARSRSARGKEKLCKAISVFNVGNDVACFNKLRTLLVKAAERNYLISESKLCLARCHSDKERERGMISYGVCKLAVKACGIYESVGVNAVHKALDNADLKLLVKRDSNSARCENCKVGCYPINAGLTDDSDALARVALVGKRCREAFYLSGELAVCNVVKLTLLIEICKENSVAMLFYDTAEILNVKNSFIKSFTGCLVNYLCCFFLAHFISSPFNNISEVIIASRLSDLILCLLEAQADHIKCRIEGFKLILAELLAYEGVDL